MWTTNFWNDFDRSFWALDALRRRMDTLFQDIGEGRFGAPAELEGGISAARMNWPRTNIYDEEHDLVLEAVVPGLSEKDLQLSVTADGVTVSGERKAEAPEGYSVHRQERGGLRFSRSFSLPSKVDPEKASAHVKDGILTVRLAKAAEAKPKQITVKAAK